jgi:hypothetical protein
MREIRPSGSEGGVGREPHPYPYPFSTAWLRLRPPGRANVGGVKLPLSFRKPPQAPVI